MCGGLETDTTEAMVKMLTKVTMVDDGGDIGKVSN
jgi:hypothetical protein